MMPSRYVIMRQFRSDCGHRAGVPAGVRSAGRVDSRRPHARPPDSHHRRHTHRGERVRSPTRIPATGPRRTSSANSRTPSMPCSRGSERTFAEQQRFAANASHELRTAGWRSRRVFLTSPATIRNRDSGALRRTPPRRQRPGDPTSPKHCSCSAGRPAILHPRTRRPVPHRGRSHRNAPPPRRKARRHHRGLRGHYPRRRLTRSLAADDHEPPAQRDRPQPP